MRHKVSATGLFMVEVLWFVLVPTTPAERARPMELIGHESETGTYPGCGAHGGSDRHWTGTRSVLRTAAIQPRAAPARASPTTGAAAGLHVAAAPPLRVGRG